LNQKALGRNEHGSDQFTKSLLKPKAVTSESFVNALRQNEHEGFNFFIMRTGMRLVTEPGQDLRTAQHWLLPGFLYIFPWDFLGMGWRVGL
jgi:hypothetical protein